MPRTSEIVDRLRQHLRTVDPDLDTSVGSVTRKIIDMVAEGISEVYGNQDLLTYAFDVESKSGGDLDEFVQVFGFFRTESRRATGSVTFSRNSPATEDISIPLGAQVIARGNRVVTVSTSVPATLLKGETSVSVPVRAVAGGVDGNLEPNSLTQLASNLQGIGSVTNDSSLSGGRSAESDDELRARFRRTLFSSLAGTEESYLGLALEDDDVTHANIVGIAKRHREQIEITAGTATSSIQDAKHIFPGSSILATSLEGGTVFIPGVHYSFDDTSNPPTVTSLDGTEVPDGVYDLEFEYQPNASRNDVAAGIDNRVDLYVHGERVEEAVENLIFDAAVTFVNDGSALDIDNFEREDGTTPTTGNFFIRYGFTPVVDPSTDDTLLIDGTTYTEGTDFFRVRNITNEGGGPRSLEGVELVSVANGGIGDPTTGSPLSVTYAYDIVPTAIAGVIEQQRVMNTDVMVHRAKRVWLDVHLVVILDPGYTTAGVRSDVFALLEQAVARVGFNNVLQTSDLLAVAHRVEGVDAVRLVTSTDDATNYAIQRVASDGTTVLETYADTSGRAIDVVSDDDELPVLNDVTLDRRAANTFHVDQ